VPEGASGLVLPSLDLHCWGLPMLRENVDARPMPLALESRLPSPPTVATIAQKRAEVSPRVRRGGANRRVRV